MKLADTKLESSDAYLIKYGKNWHLALKLWTFFGRNQVFKICSDLKRFYSDYKINYIFFKFKHNFFFWYKN